MSKIEIKIIDDLEQCKQWGYNEPVLLISGEYSSHVLQSSRVCMHEIELIIKRLKDHEKDIKNMNIKGDQ